MATFEGTISNCKSTILTNVSGNVKVSTSAFGGVSGGAKRKLNTNTTRTLS